MGFLEDMMSKLMEKGVERRVFQEKKSVQGGPRGEFREFRVVQCIQNVDIEVGRGKR